MDLKAFANNFDLLLDTPGAVARLRDLVLSLAVRGKLVPQDPNDEPASVLLERIQAEKARLIAEEKIKEPKQLPPIGEKEMPFALPRGWVWVRLGEVVRLSSGDALPSYKMEPGKIPVYGGNGIAGYHDKYNVDKQTIVIGRVGFYCGSIHLSPEQAWVTDNAFITHYSKKNIDQNFFVWFLKAADLGQNDNSTAQPVISGRKVYPIPIPLPPLAEQKRIVARLDLLMKFCDELEEKLKRSDEEGRRLLDAAGLAGAA